MKSYQEIFDHALLMFSHGIQPSSILNFVARETEALIGDGSAVSVLLIDCDGVLRNGASPSLPVDYLEAIDGIRPNPNLGTCAAAAATGETVITKSFLADDKWSELKHLPMSLGYAGAWSVPIKTQRGKVVGTIGVYQRDMKFPQDQDLQGIGLLAKAAAHVLTFQPVSG